MNELVRQARMRGIVLLAVTFAVGLGVGAIAMRAYAKKNTPPDPSIKLIVTTSDQLPIEISRLRISDAQRDSVRAALRRGSLRVEHIVDEFDPRVQAAVDSTDAEIRALLNATQRAAFDSARRANGPLLRRKKRVDGPRQGDGAPTR